MKEMLQYLKDNPNYVIALAVTTALLILACVLGYFIKKYDWLKFTDKWFKKDKKAKPTQSNKTSEDEATPKSPYGGEIIFEDPAVAFADKNPSKETPDSESRIECIPDDVDCPPCDDAPTPVEEQPQEATLPQQKKSRLSEMLENSFYDEITEEYEEGKRRTTTKQTIVIVEEKTEIPPISQEIDEYEGKWRVIRSGSTFVAGLYTEDEKLLIKSEHYSAFSDAKQSIETLKKNIEGNNFSIAVNKKGGFYFKLFSPSGRLICCGEPCKTNDECKEAIEQTKRLAFTAEIVRG